MNAPLQQSPPPEPTPSPPPPSLPQATLPSAPRQPPISQSPVRPAMDSQGNITMAGTASPIPVRSPTTPVSAAQGSPVPVPSVPYHPANVAPAQVYQPGLPRRSNSFAPQTPNAVPFQTAAIPHAYGATPYTSYQTSRLHVPAPTVYNPNAPRQIEVFQLSDAANAAIPEDIREQFHCDDQGHVLFFPAPPLDIIPSTCQKLGHSLEYLAAKEERRKKVEDRKRKATEQGEEREESAKRARSNEEASLATKVETLTNKAIERMTSHITDGTNKLYEALYQDQAENARLVDAQAREQRIQMDRVAQRQTAEIKARSQEASFVSLRGNAMYMDDVEPAA